MLFRSVGSRARTNGMIESGTAGNYLLAALAALCASMAWVHLKFLPPGTLATHPLNGYGLIYHLPLIAVVTSAVIRFAPTWRGLPGTAVLLRFGRNSMLAFVLHVYCAIALQLANRWVALPMAVNIVVIVASVFVMNRVLECYEAQRTLAFPPVWVRALTSLFG